MKKSIVILLFLAICTITNAQENKSATIAELKRNLQNTGEDTTRVSMLRDLANAFGVNRPDSSLFYFLKALTLARKIPLHTQELRALLGIEVTLKHNGNTVKAFSTAFKGLKLSEKYEDMYFRAQFLGELGILDGELGNHTTALKLLRESQQIFNSFQERELATFQLNNIGEVYLRMGNLDSALYYCQAAFDAETPVNFWIDYYSALNLGRIFLQKQEYDMALFYFKESLKTAVFFSHHFNSNLSVAMAYERLHKIDSCLFYANKSMDIAHESRIFAQQVDINNFFATFYKKDDPERALEFARTALIYKDSLSRFAERLVMESFTEFDEQERQYEIQNAQAAYRYEVRQYALLSGLGALVLIAAILFRNNTHKQKANKLLFQQKEEISVQREKAESALTELKTTQSQLIQSEKMASLGAMAAGIAHEIQNPLNFVNNFSEVNKELLEELKQELASGRSEDIQSIANSIIENEEKIVHHGKRADAIVKGMLQHSRAASGQKEPTDINALCDEYLRLSYHGFRARDKSFNAKLETDFDSSLQNINVVPQDFGRAILNLINNAFYAVAKKSSSEKASVDKNYEPTVKVGTKLSVNKILISVKDNGNGIPENIKEKIFQPFFTTKPTGEGTGLGLSITYDIVRAHGGELKTETRDGEGSEFVITLPIL